MKTLFFVMTLAISFGAFASENMASDCSKTLHSEDRENSKVELDNILEVETGEASAVEQ